MVSLLPTLIAPLAGCGLQGLALEERAEHEVQALMQKLDKNADGKVSSGTQAGRTSGQSAVGEARLLMQPSGPAIQTASQRPLPMSAARPLNTSTQTAWQLLCNAS
jgi:hypothetical protein